MRLIRIDTDGIGATVWRAVTWPVFWNYNLARHAARRPRVDVKMKLRGSWFAAPAAIAVCVLSGCASVPQSGIDGGTTEVKVYGSERLPAGQYEVVSRLWMDSWRAAFWLPTYPSEAEGITSLQTEAGRLGANGLINVVCLDQGHSKWSWSDGPAFLCYGSAIHVRRNGG